MPLPEIVLPEDSIVPQPLAEPAAILASWPLFGHQYTTTAPPELAADSSQLMPLPEIVLPEDSIVPQPLAEPASMLASWPLFGHQYTTTAMPAENAAPATIQVDTAVPGSIVASATTASLVMSPVAVADVAAQSGAVPLL